MNFNGLLVSLPNSVLISFENLPKCAESNDNSSISSGFIEATWSLIIFSTNGS